jgi:endonuclease YncB( thermonuclease family)
MTRPWNPNKWLSPEDYARLSPLERKRLWRERGHARTVERHNRTYRPRARRMPNWQWKLLVALALIVGMPVARWIADDAPSGWSSQPAPTARGQAGVRASFHQCKWGGGTNCVVDGDTIYLEGQKIRIAGIDAPETHDYGCPEELALGDRATDRLQQLLNGGAITLSSIDRDEDVYGRKLREVAVDGSDVGDTLISEGLARAYGGGRRSWCS